EDRDAVRTPMQWTPDRNAGFSSVDPGKLYLPVISSLVYHHNAVNVEAQMATSSSLLHWVRGMLQVRSRHQVFGLGDFRVCPSDNDAVLSFVRSTAGAPSSSASPDVAEAVLCVNNLASRPQASTVHLPEEYAGAQLLDLFGGQGFPQVGDDGRVVITLGSRDFFWLQLRGESAHG
ncbi:MAG: alpha-glucosidase C-terminal domain-containing protein, partial [Lapillicoccus sp.]